MSLAGRAILVNSILMPITTYQLSCVAIHDSILDQISQVARKFLWGGRTNRSGFHTLGWSTTTLDKADGGLGIRNLRNAKFALMSKNVFSVLNSDDKLWVHIFKLKYGDFHCWNIKHTARASCFYRLICKVTLKIKPNCWIREFNPAE